MTGSLKWYQQSYRRNVIDMHITADDPRFLRSFDPQAYVERLLQAQVQSTVLYAQSHVGLCYFPTRVGQIHPGLDGRDQLGEMITRIHQSGMGVVVYFSLIFDAWAYHSHPDWRIHDSLGRPSAENSRYGVCCPNSPYREYVRAIVTELCAGYEFEGIRFDMTFWPRVCYCHYCRERFAREVGGDLPVTIDWNDPAWVAFQRARERWLVEFAGIATDTVRRCKPAASVEHQASTYPLTWQMGVTTDLAQHNDFLQGDFYGDALQGSFVRKLLSNLTPNRPAGFETSISLDLSNYTALKPESLLRCKAGAALADHTAFIMIDSIDPTGALDPRVYAREGRVFEEMKIYQAELGGEPLHDVAVYFSTESKYDPADNGKNIEDPGLSGRMPHLEAVFGACKALLDCHIPFTVITRRNLNRLADFKAILLPDVLMMDEIEAAALREYVRAGGSLYASGVTSLHCCDGAWQPDFMLADVFGVSIPRPRDVESQETREHFTYIAPFAGSESLFGDFTHSAPLGFAAAQRLVQVRPESASSLDLLGEQVLPYTDPADSHHFASIHNNPPGRWTSAPAITLHRYGQGRCIYAALALEKANYARELFTNLLLLLVEPVSLRSNAPSCVEITVYQQPEKQRWLIHLINFQKDMPNIPIQDVVVTLKTGEHLPERVSLLPGKTPLPFEIQTGWLEFTLPRLETYAMVEIAW